MSTLAQPRQLFTAEDIRRLARERSETLLIAPDDIVTHEAIDVAIALGVKLIRETESTVGPRKEAPFGTAQARPPASPNLPPLKVVHLANIQLDAFTFMESEYAFSLCTSSVSGLEV